MTSNYGTFFERIDHLRTQVGHGPLVAKNEMNQVYAKYQELREDLKHPRGGGAHYARNSLLGHIDEHMGTLAHKAITEDGSDIVGAAIDVANRMGELAEEHAPVEFANLRRSRHATVTDDGELIYDRPPDVPRLSDAQLRDQRYHGHGLDYGADTRPRL